MICAIHNDGICDLNWRPPFPVWQTAFLGEGAVKAICSIYESIVQKRERERENGYSLSPKTLSFSPCRKKKLFPRRSRARSSLLFHMAIRTLWPLFFFGGGSMEGFFCPSFHLLLLLVVQQPMWMMVMMILNCRPQKQQRPNRHHKLGLPSNFNFSQIPPISREEEEGKLKHPSFFSLLLLPKVTPGPRAAARTTQFPPSSPSSSTLIILEPKKVVVASFFFGGG